MKELKSYVYLRRIDAMVKSQLIPIDEEPIEGKPCVHKCRPKEIVVYYRNHETELIKISLSPEEIFTLNEAVVNAQGALVEIIHESELPC